MTAPPDGGAGERRAIGPGAVAAYALVLVLAVQNAVWSAFLLPLRVGGVLVPVSLLLAGVGTAALGVAGARALGRRGGAVAPGAVWVVLALLAGSKRAEGDIVATGGAGSGLATLSLLYLAVGAVGAAAGYGLSARPTSRARPAPAAGGPPPISTSPEAPPGR